MKACGSIYSLLSLQNKICFYSLTQLSKLEMFWSPPHHYQRFSFPLYFLQDIQFSHTWPLAIHQSHNSHLSKFTNFKSFHSTFLCDNHNILKIHIFPEAFKKYREFTHKVIQPKFSKQRDFSLPKVVLVRRISLYDSLMKLVGTHKIRQFSISQKHFHLGI